MRKLEEINIIIEEATDKEFSILEYTGSDNPVLIKHNKCGHIFKNRNYRKKDIINTGCKKCNKEKRLELYYKERDNEYKNSFMGTEYIPLEKFKGAKEKIKFLHKECGQEFSMIAKNKKYIKCPKCINGVPKIEILQKDLDASYGKGNYKIKDFNTRKDFIAIHKCGYERKMDSSNFNQKNSCPKCEGGRVRYTHETFKDEIYRIFEDEYTLISEFINTSTKVKIRHNKCGKVRESFPNHLLKGTECRSCKLIEIHKGRIGVEHFLKELHSTPDGNEYKLVGDYINGTTKIELLHTVCGKSIFSTPVNIIRSGTRCRCTRKSKAEIKIEHYLTTKRIPFEMEYTFKDCINPKTEKNLRFDFALFDSKGSLNKLIEYDGQQHFIAVPHFGGEEKLKLQQELDEIKNAYCRENNIELIRINYKHFNKIEKILEKVV